MPASGSATPATRCSRSETRSIASPSSRLRCMPTESDELELSCAARWPAWTRRLRRSDLATGSCQRLSPSATSLAEAIDELWQLPADAPERDHHAESLRMARSSPLTLPRLTVEDELGRMLDEAGLTEPKSGNRRPPSWLGRPGRDDARGRRQGRAHEGARAAVESGRETVRTRRLRCPRSRRRSMSSTEHAPIRTTTQLNCSSLRGLAGMPFNPVGLLNAARLAGMTCSAPMRMAASTRAISEASGSVAEAARKLVSRNGAASVSPIFEALDGADRC